MIREAEGEAEAILKVQQAAADGIRFIKEAGADDAVLKIKSLEAFERQLTARRPRSLSHPKSRDLQECWPLPRKCSMADSKYPA